MKFKVGDYITIVADNCEFLTPDEREWLGNGTHKISFIDFDDTLGVYRKSSSKDYLDNYYWLEPFEVEFAKEHYLDQFNEQILLLDGGKGK